MKSVLRYIGFAILGLVFCFSPADASEKLESADKIETMFLSSPDRFSSTHQFKGYRKSSYTFKFTYKESITHSKGIPSTQTKEKLFLLYRSLKLLG